MLKNIVGNCENCTYVCWTLENSGPQPNASRAAGKSWTPHLQLAIFFEKTVRPSFLKTNLPNRCHFDNRHGSVEQATSYCNPDSDKYEERKGGPGFCGIKCPFIEFGTCPAFAPGKRNDLMDLKAIIDAGGSTADLFEKSFSTTVRYHKGLSFYALVKHQHAPVRMKTVLWLWGDTGSGKSRLAARIAKDYGGGVYRKMGNNKWFDGLDHSHKIVIFDDFEKSTAVTFNMLLRLCDTFALLVECKGSTVAFAPELIIITSHLSPREMYEERSDDEYAQLARRIDAIKHLTTGANVHRVRDAGRKRKRAQSALRMITASVRKIDESDESSDDEGGAAASSLLRTPSPGPAVPAVRRRTSGLAALRAPAATQRHTRQPSNGSAAPGFITNLALSDDDEEEEDAMEALPGQPIDEFTDRESGDEDWDSSDDRFGSF